MSERTVNQLRSLNACKSGCEGRCSFCPDEVGRQAADEIERLRSALLEARGWMLCDEDLSDQEDFKATLAKVDAALGGQS